jgi:hypothetical protein
MPGVTLDTGALIAIERADRRMQALLDEAYTAGLSDARDLRHLDARLRIAEAS